LVLKLTPQSFQTAILRNQAYLPFVAGDRDFENSASMGIDKFALRAARDLPQRMADRPDFGESLHPLLTSIIISQLHFESIFLEVLL
jgi:hypothetical protein